MRRTTRGMRGVWIAIAVVAFVAIAAASAIAANSSKASKKENIDVAVLLPDSFGSRDLSEVCTLRIGARR